MARQQLPFEALRPLIRETAAKIETLSPAEAQTGPAVRYDKNVMQKHIDLLDDPDEKEIYRLLEPAHTPVCHIAYPITIAQHE